MTAATKDDIMSHWLRERRSGGDPELRERVLRNLAPIRDRVLAGANLGAGNPRIPTVAEAMDESLTTPERAAFEACIRPQVEAGRGRFQSSHTYLTAIRPFEQEKSNAS